MALGNCNNYTIEKFLHDRFHIPSYQREYSWETNELTDFWNDLVAAKDRLEEKTSMHFFGQIVIHNDEEQGKKYIIDGQQRTTTSIIFLRALQVAYLDLYISYGFEPANRKASHICADYIEDDSEIFRLELGNLDCEYFKDFILSRKPSECPKTARKSNERLRAAYLFFEKNINHVLAGYSEPADKKAELDKYLETFTKHFNVLSLESNDLNEAFIIFETLNARGKDLETADLLKNFIFRNTGNIETSQSKWNNIIDNLNSIDTTKFIRHFWNACHSFSRDRELYRNISQAYDKADDRCDDLLNKLEELSKYYHDMASPNEDSESDFTDEICDKLVILKTLKASTYYPIILAMLVKDHSFGEILSVLNTIEVYIFRNFTICNKVANTAEVFFASTALKIYENKLNSASEISDHIKINIVSDEEFYNSFRYWTSNNSGKEIVRYILRRIHKFNDNAHEINVDNSEVHIEHIMPQNAAKWDVSEEEHEEYLWRLGNLALLSGRRNTSISNGTFAEKRQTYIESKIEPNASIAREEYWNKDTIDNRQREFADDAIVIWAK